MELWMFIKPLGIVAYSLVAITAISGLLKWKLKIHKNIAITAVILATMHAVLVIFFD